MPLGTVSGILADVPAGDDRYELNVFSASGAATYALAPGAHLVVGRGDDADIPIDDVAISRKHAVFHGGPPVTVEDLGSSNGTFMSPAAGGDGKAQTADNRRIKVTKNEVADGDSVFFGAAVVVVRKKKVAVAPERSAVVRAPSMLRLYEEAARAAKSTLPILVLGETGVGKDVLARTIHDESPRAKAPFVAFNCAALSESLAEAELFGHEKGAFTGAQSTRAGLFEAAEGGTVFLDEIGELPLATQAKLLRTLESGEVTRVGSAKAIKVDVRFVSATNRDLERDSAGGRFRRDLYFRVNGLTLRIPPLRERKEEIAELARRFLATAATKMAIASPPRISAEALSALDAHAWPGNVRELRFVMERALVSSAGAPEILAKHLGLDSSGASGGAPSSSRDATTNATREQVIDALEKCDGNQTRAAELLGVSRRTLINRMIEFNLPRPRKG
jgi:two-component system, NtrC family, response regulator AtoC